MSQPNRPTPESEWELLDEIGRTLADAIELEEKGYSGILSCVYEAKNKVNQLKSLLAQRSRKVE